MKNVGIESKSTHKKLGFLGKINTDYVLLVVATLTLLAVIADLVIDKTRFDESNSLTKDLISDFREIKVQTSKKSEINDEIYSRIEKLIAQQLGDAKLGGVSSTPEIRDVKIQFAYPTQVMINKINEGADFSKELALIKKVTAADLKNEIAVLENFLANQVSIVDVQKQILHTLSSDKTVVKEENVTFKDTLKDFFGSVLSIHKRNEILNEKIINDRLTIALELLNTKDVAAAYFILSNITEKYLDYNIIEAKLRSIKEARKAADSIMKYSLNP